MVVYVERRGYVNIPYDGSNGYGYGMVMMSNDVCMLGWQETDYACVRMVQYGIDAEETVRKGWGTNTNTKMNGNLLRVQTAYLLLYDGECTRLSNMYTARVVGK